jgi:hypothetical protein
MGEQDTEERKPWSMSGLIQQVLNPNLSSLISLRELDLPTLVTVFGSEVGLSMELKGTEGGYNYRDQTGQFRSPSQVYITFREYFKQTALKSKRTSRVVASLETAAYAELA